MESVLYLIGCLFAQAREHEHKQQVRVLELNAAQESLVARRSMDESTRHARDAARDAQHALHEVRVIQGSHYSGNLGENLASFSRRGNEGENRWLRISEWLVSQVVTNL